MKKAVFLDRDGVINVDRSYVYKIEEFTFCEGVFDALIHFQKLGYLLIIVTNQSGIARGYYSEEDFQVLTHWMKQALLEKGVIIDAIYHCPHAPKDHCECRKPKGGMFQEAFKTFEIDPLCSWMIGDKISDIQAANSGGIENTILIGNEPKSGAKYSVNFILATINIIQH